MWLLVTFFSVFNDHVVHYKWPYTNCIRMTNDQTLKDRPFNLVNVSDLWHHYFPSSELPTIWTEMANKLKLFYPYFWAMKCVCQVLVNFKLLSKSYGPILHWKMLKVIGSMVIDFFSRSLCICSFECRITAIIIIMFWIFHSTLST